MSETIVRHTFSAKVGGVWRALTSLSNYNLWFPGIRQILPIVDAERYAHKFSFDRFDFSPGSFVLVRTNAISPLYRGRIMAVELNKELTFSLRFNPLSKELVTFTLETASDGNTIVTCKRTSKGLFSFFTLFGFSGAKSHILSNLGFFIREDNVGESPEVLIDKTSTMTPEQELSMIAFAVQAGLSGNMDPIAVIGSKATRGKAKSLLVRAKRGGSIQKHLEKALKDGPPPESDSADASDASALPLFSNDDDCIAYVVNEAIGGNMDPINSIKDKALRGKAKSAMVRAKRSGNLPPMPKNIPEVSPVNTAAVGNEESEDDFIQRLVDEGLGGNMDSINAVDDRTLRAKVKSALVKARRAQK